MRRACEGRGAVATAGDGANVGDGAVADALVIIARPDARAPISGNDRMGGRDA